MIQVLEHVKVMFRSAQDKYVFRSDIDPSVSQSII